jgi:hypothetical protein
MRVSVESWKQVWCRSQARIDFQNELLGQFGQNEVRLMIPFRLGLNVISDKIFGSVLPFQTNYVLNKQSWLNSTLTSNRTDLGKVPYTNIVDNFNIFPVSIKTPSSEKWSRSS